MTTTETEQTWEKLAGATKPCLACEGTGRDRLADEHRCGVCFGTGEVLLLPELSEKCEDTHYRNVNSAPTRSARARLAPLTCKEAGCTGRVPKPMHLEGLQATLIVDGLYLHVSRKVEIWKIRASSLESLTQAILTAWIEAAWKAVQAKYPQEKKVWTARN